MKKLLMTISAGVLLVSCGGEATKASDVETIDSTKAEVAVAEKTVEVSTYVVNAGESVLNWKGSALAKSHNGTVAVKSGSVEVSEGAISGGELEFDMTTITCLDLDEATGKGKLEGHLKDKDFFNVDSFPSAKIIIRSVAADNVTAELTIKDVTKSISFPATIDVTETAVSVTAQITINRTDFGVVYGSGNFFDLAKDKAISDDIEFDVVVKAAK